MSGPISVACWRHRKTEAPQTKCQGLLSSYRTLSITVCCQRPFCFLCTQSVPSLHMNTHTDIDTICMIMHVICIGNPTQCASCNISPQGTANRLGGNSGETAAFRLHSLFHGVCCSSLKTRSPGFNLELRLAAIGQREGSEHAKAHNIQGDPFIISHFPDPLLSTLIFDN